MKLRSTLSLLAFTTFVTACGTTAVQDPDAGDGAPTTETSVVTDRPNPPVDRPNPPAPDVPNPPDLDVPDMPNDVPDQPMDVPDMPFDVPPGVDVPNFMIDMPNPPAPDVPNIIPDAGGPMCPMAGLNDICPLAGGLGACAPLTAGMRTIDLTGLNTGISASCEGAQTGVGPDGAIPLVLLAASDVTIALTPFGGAATVSVFTAMGCGVPAQERGCFNSSGGPGPLSLPNLQPGTYWVVFSHANAGGVVTATTTITPARPRVAGDACPGVMVPTDGTRVTVDTAMFQRAVDVGTNCMVGGGANGDAVLSYTLMETSDVTINLLPQAGVALTLDVQTTCGTRASAVGACIAGGGGNAVTRTINRQAPGTYYIVSEYRGGAMNPTFLASVRAVRSPAAAMADRCPGEPLTFGTTTMIPVASIAQDQAFSCFGASTADGNFSFNAPMGQEVLVEVTSSGNQTALELQAPCGMNSMACTSATVGGANRSWRRYSGLVAGNAYSVHAGTNSPGGTLNVTARSLNASMPAAVMGNEACASARPIMFALNTPVVLTGDTSMMGADAAAPAFGGGAICNNCNTQTGRDAVYTFTLAARTRILGTARSGTMGFDPVMYVRNVAPCNNGNSIMNPTPILFCADDYYGQDAAFDRTFDPGTYSLFLDSCNGFGGGGGGQPTGGRYTLELIPLAP